MVAGNTRVSEYLLTELKTMIEEELSSSICDSIDTAITELLCMLKPVVNMYIMGADRPEISHNRPTSQQQQLQSAEQHYNINELFPP